MNSLASFLAFSLAMAFQFSSGVVLLYLALHPEDRHRLPRLLAFFTISLITHKAVHDGTISVPWELYVLSAGWTLGIYSLISLVLRIMRAHHLATKIREDGNPVCLDCPLLADVTHGSTETPRRPMPPIRFFEFVPLPAWLGWIAWLPWISKFSRRM